MPFPVACQRKFNAMEGSSPSAGNVPLLQFSSGSGHVETIQDGNDLGDVYLTIYGVCCKAISCDAGPEEIKTKVNAILPSFRSIEVEKLASSKHRHEWLITFHLKWVI